MLLLLPLNIIAHTELRIKEIKFKILTIPKEQWNSCLSYPQPQFAGSDEKEKAMSIHFSQIEVTNGLNLNQCGRNHKVIKVIS